MPSAKYLDPTKRLHCLSVGPSGSGKTCAAVTAFSLEDVKASNGRIEIVDIDMRVKGILGVPYIKPYIDANVINFEQFAPDSADNLGRLSDHLDYLLRETQKGNVFEVVFDSTNHLVSLILIFSLAKSGIKHSKITIGKKEIEMTQKQDFNLAYTVVREAVYKQLKSLKCNLFVSSHLKDKVIAAPTAEDPERTIVIGRTFKVPGQLADDLPTWFDETWEFEVDDSIRSSEPKRFVRFKSALAKTCMPSMPVRVDITGKPLYEVLASLNGTGVKK